MARQPLVITGAVLLGVSVLIPIILLNTGRDGVEGLVEGLVFTFVIAPVLFITGLVLLIMGASSGHRQQQQQQVVVMAAPGMAPVQVSQACPRCRAGIAQGIRFCTACGSKV